MTKTNKIYLTFRSNLTKIVSFCTFLLIIFFGLAWILTNGNVTILSINQDISCTKFLSKQKFEILVQNNNWYPQLSFIKVRGVDLQRDPEIKYFIKNPNLISKLLNTLQAFGYLDEQQAYFSPIFLSGNQTTTLKVNQDHPIKNSIQCPIISLHARQNNETKRSIKLHLDKDYENPTTIPKLNEKGIFESTYEDNNQVNIKIQWNYTQYFSVSNFMG